jgi:hypothetical protein
MARIRTIKPDFFRHEGLQDIERDNPGQHVMLTFAGLWTLCDKAGRFEWKPRTIKLDVLPFLEFDMGTTLLLLERFSYVRRYEVDGKVYGCIPSFGEHQRINGKESQEPARYPEPVEFLAIDSEGSGGEATGKQPRSQERKGKGREKEGEGNGGSRVAVLAAPTASPGSEAWAAYCQAYESRYGAEPKRNATVNAQMAQVVKRLGADEAPHVAAWYVAHNAAYYVQRGHSVAALLSDCEKLRTEWATGNRITSTKARQLDKTQANGDVWGKLIAEAEDAQRAN